MIHKHLTTSFQSISSQFKAFFICFFRFYATLYLVQLFYLRFWLLNILRAIFLRFLAWSKIPKKIDLNNIGLPRLASAHLPSLKYSFDYLLLLHDSQPITYEILRWLTVTVIIIVHIIILMRPQRLI